MAGDDNNDSLRKVLKLKVPADFIQWRRKMKTYIQRNDLLLVGLQPRLSGRAASASSKTLEDWTLKSARAKGNIILCLGDSVASQTRLFLDDGDKTTGDLWRELERIFTMSNTQVVQNLKQKLDSLIFKEHRNFDTQVASFLTIVGELATYDSELSASEKTSKLIRSLPPSFAPLAMVSNIQEFDFETLVNSVRAELARRSNPHNPQNKYRSSAAELRANFVQHSRGVNGRGRGKNRRGIRHGLHQGTNNGRIEKRKCDYCHIQGHTAIAGSDKESKREKVIQPLVSVCIKAVKGAALPLRQGLKDKICCNFCSFSRQNSNCPLLFDVASRIRLLTRLLKNDKTDSKLSNGANSESLFV